MRILLLILALGLAGCSTPETPPAPSEQAATGEQNVNPDINRNYKSPALDVERWAKQFSGESREVFAARFEVLAALGLNAGDRIADIGAGTGLYTQLFAETVGAQGQVFAVDIAEPFLEFIAENAAADGLDNVQIVLGEDRASMLPAGSVDVIFHCDTYHHFEYPKSMNQDLARALVSGGELFVLEFERIPGETPEWILDHVRAGKETVRAEIESSGFTFVEQLAVPGLKDNYLLRFKKS